MTIIILIRIQNNEPYKPLKAIREDEEEEGLHEGTDTWTITRVIGRTNRIAAVPTRRGATDGCQTDTQDILDKWGRSGPSLRVYTCLHAANACLHAANACLHTVRRHRNWSIGQSI